MLSDKSKLERHIRTHLVGTHTHTHSSLAVLGIWVVSVDEQDLARYPTDRGRKQGFGVCVCFVCVCTRVCAWLCTRMQVRMPGLVCLVCYLWNQKHKTGGQAIWNVCGAGNPMKEALHVPECLMSLSRSAPITSLLRKPCSHLGANTFPSTLTGANRGTLCIAYPPGSHSTSQL